MATADKLITVAKNVPKVYHAGQLNVIENTSTLKKSASGSAIFIDDISPVTHDMGVKVRSKNLLDINQAKNSGVGNAFDTFLISDNIVTATSDNSILTSVMAALFKGELPAGDYVLSLNAVIENTPNHRRPNEILVFKNGSVITLNNTMQTDGTYSPTLKFTLSEKANIEISFYKNIIFSSETVSDTVYKVTLSNIQLELGTTATAYTPYVPDLTAVKVSRYGKNLFTFANRNAADFGSSVNTAKRNFIENCYYYKVSANNYYNNSIDYEILNNNSFTMTTTNAYGLGVNFKVNPKETYTVSCDMEGNGRIGVAFYDSEGTWLSAVYDVSPFVVPENCKWAVICFTGFMDAGKTENVSFKNIQLEIGTSASDFEPYITPTEYTPTTDGTVNGVTSLYPSTTLTTDTEGVIIDCEYYKDIDANDVIERKVTTYTNPKIKIIGDYAFYGCTSLTSANFFTATSIGNHAFHNCSALTSADIPVATNIGSDAFFGCTSLTTADIPAATSIGSDAFYGCTSLTIADFPVATSIGNHAFHDCSALTSADITVATNIGGYAFFGCTSLTSINFPAATSIGNHAFHNCTSLISADFPAATNIGGYAFYGCSALTALILRSNTICTLSNKNAFTGCTHITGTGGYIYVPSSLIDTYKTATNWVTYASKFRALEDYTVDGTTTGALDESKVSA